MMWSICMRNLFLNPENKTCAYLLLVGPVAKTSDCSFGKNPCSYFPWPIFMSSRWGWMAVWSIFIRRCSMDWAAGDSHRWAIVPPPSRGHALPQQQWPCSDPWKPTRELNGDPNHFCHSQRWGDTCAVGFLILLLVSLPNTRALVQAS